MITIKVDIIGGGIAGLSSAISIKENDKTIKVIIHEKNNKIGYNYEGRRCGEAHSITESWNKWIPSKKSIYNNITKVETTIGTKNWEYQKPIGYGYILNRQEFISELGEKAKKLGAEIRTNDQIKSQEQINGDYIIDASGCPSHFKKGLGLGKTTKALGYQETIEKSNHYKPGVLKIIFHDMGGYYWIFPRNPEKQEINIGLGVMEKYKCNLKKLLKEFKEKYDVTGKINYKTGGLIPVGLQKPLIHQNILFVGDAGVGTFPISGQGIYRALLSGDVAGKCIAENNLKKYAHTMNYYFIKWDILVKNLLKTNNILRKINKDLSYSLLNYFTHMSKMLHF